MFNVFKKRPKYQLVEYAPNKYAIRDRYGKYLSRFMECSWESHTQIMRHCIYGDYKTAEAKYNELCYPVKVLKECSDV